MTWVVAGLGNPGDTYRATRHNAGAMVAEHLAERAGERFRKVRFVPTDVAERKLGGERVLLVRSHRFMNESGPSFASVAKKNVLGLKPAPALLNTTPVGVPSVPGGLPGAGGIVTTSGDAMGKGLPAELYTVATPVALSPTHNGLVALAAMPHGFLRFGSVKMASPLTLDTRFV